MEKINFFNGMEVENTDFNKLELYFEERINKNQASLTNAGILVNADLPDGKTLSAPYLGTDNTSISVYGFVAYDQEGRLLYLAPKYNDGVQIPSIQNLKPASGIGSLANRELLSVGSVIDFGRNVEYYIVTRYNEVYTDNLRQQDITDVLIPASIIPTVSFYLRETNGILPNDVVLGKITTDSEGHVYVDETERDVLSIRGDIIASTISQNGENLGKITFDQHVNMLGSGDYSSSNPHALSPSDIGIDPAATGKHQQYEHTNGIVTSNRQSLSSALSYQFESATSTGNLNDMVVYVQALSEDNNEMAAISNTSLYPSDFNGVMSQIISQDTTPSGFYLLYLDRDTSLGLLGPYSSDTDTNFLTNLYNETLLPICSFYWGEPRFYTITLGGTLINNGTFVTNWNVLSTDEFAVYNSSDTLVASKIQIGDQIYYAPANDYLTVSSISKSVGDDFLSIKRIDTSSIKDRRPFSTLALENIKTSDLSTIKTSAPFSNEDTFCYNARVISSKGDSAFVLSGLTLSIEFDGSLCVPSLIFPSASFYTAQDVVQRINSWIEVAYTGPYSDNKPRALLNQDGKIVLLSSESIIIQNVGESSAEDILGFSEQGSDADGILKTIISEIDDEVDSVQDFYYNENGELSYIYYTLPSGSFKQHFLTYSGEGNILGYKGVI